MNARTRLRRLEQRRRLPPTPPQPLLPLAAAKRQLERWLTDVADLPDIDAELSRRLETAGRRLAAERTPTRSTMRGVIAAIDDLIAELDAGDEGG